MRIGTHMGYSSADEVAEQCRTVGVSDIFLADTTVPEYEERGHVTLEQLKPIGEELGARDIRVPGIILSAPSQEVVLGKDETGRHVAF